MSRAWSCSSALLVLATVTGAQQAPTEKNLLPNSSFEESVDGLPSEWQWNAGQAKATLALDDTVARSGLRSVKIVNQTPREPHMYGDLRTSLRVTEGRTYTLSCYVKGAQPGTAWIGTGLKWQFRFPLPAADEWTRVVGAFEADADTATIHIISESPTPALWIDDVQLQPGPRATPYAYQEPLPEGEAALEVLQGEWVSLAPNLVANSSFETLDGGFPKGWTWDRRNTDATLAVDEATAHSGKRSLKVTNGTAFGAHIYGMLNYLGGVEVEPGETYTLTCYVTSEKPGIAWIGGGPGWPHRERFPATGNEWRRVERTFTTGDETANFPLLMVTESPTEGVWLDDVKLERGDEATLYVPEDGGPQRVVLEVPENVVAGQTLALGAWLYVPEGLDDATVTAHLGGGRAPLASGEWRGDLTPGLAYAELRYGAGARSAGDCSLTVSLSSEGEEVGRAEARFVLHTVGFERERLANTRKKLKEAQALLAQARDAGLDAAYPLVSITVAENFCDWVDDDLDHREALRAAEQIDRIDEALGRAEGELKAMLAGEAERLVPRYVTSPIDIDDGSFVATVRWPDGREERRPVFFSGYGHFNSVKRDIEKFPDYGLNCFQVEFGPRSTVPAEGELSTAAIEEFKGYLARAQESNVAVNLLLSPHYFPQWGYERWPEIGGVNAGFIKFSVDAPQTRAVIEQHLRLTAAELKGLPGLHSYCLTNEPVYMDPGDDPHNREKWAAWLKERYGDLGALNAAHGAGYGDWVDVPVPADSGERDSRPYYDWCRFNNERFAGWHEWMADTIHNVDPDMPVHAKTMNTHFWRSYVGHGVDAELFCELSQIAGNDSSKMVVHEPTSWANGFQPQNMHFDLQRSVLGQPIFNSENHVIVDRDLDHIAPMHIRNVMWQAAVHGQGASTMWVWERTYDKQASSAGSIMHRPGCAEEHGRVALDLMRLAPEVTALQRAPARVAVIYSLASMIYSSEYEGLLHRVYGALNFTGEKIDFITERQLAAGKAQQYEVLFAPGVTHLPPDAHEGLAAYRGLVLAAGEDAFRWDDGPSDVDYGGGYDLLSLPDASGEELRDAILEQFAGAGLKRPVKVLDAGTGREAWGVEWQMAELDGRVLLNLVNYTPTPVRVRVRGSTGERTDLITQRRAGQVLKLAPLEPVLLSAGDGGG